MLAQTDDNIRGPPHGPQTGSARKRGGRMNSQVFREYDIRGIVENDFDDAFVVDLGRGYATLLHRAGKRTITLGRDCRLSSDVLRDLLIEGLIPSGINVVDVGVVPTPLLYFSVLAWKMDGGAMITGSHNAAEYNGSKLGVGPTTIHGAEIQRLRETIELYTEMDGRFPNHHPDPTVEENMRDLIAAVKKHHAEIGIAYDGDADRVGAVDENGRIVWGDELMVAFSRAILKERPGATIIGDVKCSKRMYDDIARHGGRPIMWKTGHSLIKSKLKEEHAALAGEMSGHMFFADRYLGFDDAIYASFRLLEIVSRERRGLAQILADLPKSSFTPEIRLDCPDERKFDLVRKAADYFRGRYDVIEIDGVRVKFPGGWGLVRASNTQPALVMRFEASDEKTLGEIRTLFEGKLKELGAM